MNLAEYFAQLPRGGKKLLALKLGVTASYLSRLVSGDRSVTAERALQIEGATEGMVNRYVLRPDLQWGSSRKGSEFYRAKTLPTVSQMMSQISTGDQSGEPSVQASSTAQASP